MKHRILSAASAVTTAMGATLAMTGTASAQLPITRATVAVECNTTTNRATLVVNVTNGARTQAPGRGAHAARNGRKPVAAGATEPVRFTTTRTRIENGTVE